MTGKGHDAARGRRAPASTTARGCPCAVTQRCETRAGRHREARSSRRRSGSRPVADARLAAHRWTALACTGTHTQSVVPAKAGTSTCGRCLARDESPPSAIASGSASGDVLDSDFRRNDWKGHDAARGDALRVHHGKVLSLCSHPATRNTRRPAPRIAVIPTAVEISTGRRRAARLHRCAAHAHTGTHTFTVPSRRRPGPQPLADVWPAMSHRPPPSPPVARRLTF